MMFSPDPEIPILLDGQVADSLQSYKDLRAFFSDKEEGLISQGGHCLPYNNGTKVMDYIIEYLSKTLAVVKEGIDAGLDLPDICAANPWSSLNITSGPNYPYTDSYMYNVVDLSHSTNLVYAFYEQGGVSPSGAMSCAASSGADV